MDAQVEALILQSTNAREIVDVEVIQPLWSNYGQLLRVNLSGSDYQSVIVKYVKIPQDFIHPKGFSNDVSRQRKIKSYQVECSWYEKYGEINNLKNRNRTAQNIRTHRDQGDFILIMEDLRNASYSNVLDHATIKQAKQVLRWLASFHASYMNCDADSLWQQGSYWHLDTRTDEFQKMPDNDLKNFAHFIDLELKIQNSLLLFMAMLN